MVFQKIYCCYIYTIVWGQSEVKKVVLLSLMAMYCPSLWFYYITSASVSVSSDFIGAIQIVLLLLLLFIHYYQVLRGHPVHDSHFLKNCQDDDRPP